MLTQQGHAESRDHVFPNIISYVNHIRCQTVETVHWYGRWTNARDFPFASDTIGTSRKKNSTSFTDNRLASQSFWLRNNYRDNGEMRDIMPFGSYHLNSWYLVREMVLWLTWYRTPNIRNHRYRFTYTNTMYARTLRWKPGRIYPLSNTEDSFEKFRLDSITH